MQSKIDSLKKIIVTETDLQCISKYFMTHLGQHQEFADCSKPITNQLLENILETILSEKFNLKLNQDQYQLYKHKSSTLIHGSIVVASYLGSFLFFEDIQIGLCSIVNMNSPENSDHIRFRAGYFPVTHH